MEGDYKMKIIEKFKKQPKFIQILDVIFIICLVYEFILTMENIPMNHYITSLMLFILFINSIYMIKS